MGVIARRVRMGVAVSRPASRCAHCNTSTKIFCARCCIINSTRRNIARNYRGLTYGAIIIRQWRDSLLVVTNGVNKNESVCIRDYQNVTCCKCDSVSIVECHAVTLRTL